MQWSRYVWERTDAARIGRRKGIRARRAVSRAYFVLREGRTADADPCDDKSRDWLSRARQIERMQTSEK